MSALKDHRRDLATCAYCPKMCRFSCPVSSATGKETHTPWGKMSAAHQHLTGARPLDEAAAAALYACTDCKRCRSHCLHQNDVGPALFEARAQAVEEGEAPRAIDLLRERFASGNPFGADLGAMAREISREADGRPYFPGCTALAREPGMVHAALDAAGGFGLRLALAPGLAGRCCGYPLWAAGLKAEFAEHAKAFARAAQGVGELVVGDPGCAYAFEKAYPQVGVELKPRVVLLVDLLAERLEYAFGRAPLRLSVSYHDACLLGRGLGRYDGPRRLLRAAVGDFLEAPENRGDGGCSGGGGLLPLTMPDAAQAVARAQATEQGSPERRIVTACPSACRNFRRAGVDATDLYTVLSRWIAARDHDDDFG